MSRSASRTKRIVQSDNDLSEAEQPLKKQLKRTSKLSAKITETENLKKANAQIAKLKKQMLKLQSQQGDNDTNVIGDDSDIESQDDEEELGFLSS
ncbi:hypothetical protein C0991_001123, partial [Blastosporella zonata]